MSLANWLEDHLTIPDEAISECADVIIGIGTDVSTDGQGPSPFSLAIARRCEELFLQTKGQQILFVGGYSHQGGPCEAQTMYQCVGLPFVSKTNVFLEINSTNTRENADNSLQLMKQNGWHTAIIVAQQWHARRVKATFRRRWKNSNCRFVVVKAPSNYGGGSQGRLNNFWKFALWDTLSFILFKLRSWA